MTISTILAGKKTYIVAAATAILAGVSAYYHTPIPEFVYALLGAAGLGTIRSAITTSTAPGLTGVVISAIESGAKELSITQTSTDTVTSN
jgi:hypothetical protein